MKGDDFFVGQMARHEIAQLLLVFEMMILGRISIQKFANLAVGVLRAQQGGVDSLVQIDSPLAADLREHRAETLRVDLAHIYEMGTARERRAPRQVEMIRDHHPTTRSIVPVHRTRRIREDESPNSRRRHGSHPRGDVPRFVSLVKMHPPLRHQDPRSSHDAPGVLARVPRDSRHRVPRDVSIGDPALDVEALHERSQSRTEHEAHLRIEVEKVPWDHLRGEFVAC